MEKLNGKKAYVPKYFTGVMAYSDTPDYDIHHETSPLLIKNLLYHSYNNPCSIEDYSIELGVSISYIEDYVNRLVEMQLLKKCENKKYITTIAFIDGTIQRKVLDTIRNTIGDYKNEVLQFAKTHISEYKSILDDKTIPDNLLMWTFIFNIINYSEDLGTIQYSKVSKKGTWDYYMSESNYLGYEDEFFVSSNSNKDEMGLQIRAFPSSSNTGVNEVGRRLSYGKAASGHSENIAAFRYLLNNEVNIHHLDELYAKDVKRYINLGYFKVENDVVRIAVPVLKESDYKLLMKKVSSDNGLKEAFLKMYNCVRKVIEQNIPDYLSEQKDFIVSCSAKTIRSLIITEAFHQNMLSFGSNDDYFVYNMFVLKKD